MSQVPTPPNPEAPLARIPFSAKAEASIKALCNWMQIAAVVSIIGAVINLVSAFMPRIDVGKGIQAVVAFLIALWIFQAGTSFRKVVTSDTADQRNLMEGFGLLRRVFLLKSILVIISLSFLVLALVMLVVVMMVRPSMN